MTAPVPDKAVRLVDDFAKKVASADSLSAGTPTGAYLSKVGIAAQEEESDARAALLAYIAGVVKGREPLSTLERDVLKAVMAERDRLRDELAAIKVAAEDSTEYVLAVVNQELRAELEQARKDAVVRIGPTTPDNSMVICPRCTSQFHAISMEDQRHRKDAERYWWLRHAWVVHTTGIKRGIWINVDPARLQSNDIDPCNALDAAIDAALSGTRP